MTDTFNRNEADDIIDIDRYSDILKALEDAGSAVDETPYGARKTAEIDVQFSLDPTYGLTKERYGWFSNGAMFDSSFFYEQNGKIRMETTATSGDIARLRSAFPGQYSAHSLAEPGIGARIAPEHLEYDSDGYVSLTHGEISLEIAQWDSANDQAHTAHGISYEDDGAYHQVRSGGQNIEFTHQSDWNIDPMDGTGPSGTTLRPERGYVYLFIYTWYGEGSYILAVQDARTQEIFPVHKYPSTGGVPAAVNSPNMPLSVTVENKQTADPLSILVGGMQFTTHGSPRSEISRTTEESRQTSGGSIATNVVTSENAVDPYAEPGTPLISARRDETSIRPREGLKFTVNNFFLNVDQDCWVFIFDEYDPSTALTGATFTTPVSRDTGFESRLVTDTQATDYTPTDSVLRGMSFVSSTNKQTQEIAGDTTSNVPLRGTAVITAALATGSTSTDASPMLLEMTERF